jgi:hypothetical protein
MIDDQMVHLEINTHRTAYVNFAPCYKMKYKAARAFYLLYVQNMNTKHISWGVKAAGA